MISILELKQILNAKLIGDSSIAVDKLVPLGSKESGGLSIVFRQSDLSLVYSSQADVIVGPEMISKRAVNAKAKLIVQKFEIDRVNHILLKLKQMHIQNAAKRQDKDAKPLFDKVVIGVGSKIGKNCYFAPGVVIGNFVTIGDNVSVNSNTVIKDNTEIGNNVIIDSNCSIGNNSFEYFTDFTGEYQRLLSLGKLVIEDNVEIGCNCTLDRGTIDETRIGQGTKIDNLVQIGHDVKIGRRCILVSQVGIAGWTTLEDNVILHGQVGVTGGITIGKNTIAHGQAGITKSIQPNSRVSGYPARNSKDFLRSVSKLNKL
ncbi:UDP-3-O-(3-hydroxymyristoyl)glucosamine N-acyltransferase [Vibrio parahaemolyticus]|uniref:UDP-3-O-(3-hydroxymyristoyl)glucosamine N-acyltransferase n=1 Tax=Vibrio parahaemolyticus TaxID=670 RepID=UPI0015DD96D3|nr:UDP-3-O-(3-hydroxymyristoyl)glucosamine N-acyltransferase [Vibrio parahaemolyticus]